MATIDSVLIGTAMDWPSHATIARNPTTGDQFAFLRYNGSDTYRLYLGNVAGTSWNQIGGFSRANLIEWSSLHMDPVGRTLHLAYRVSDGSTDRLFYRRFNISGLTWSAELQVSGTSGSGDANGGVPGAFWQGVDLAVVRNRDASYAIAVVGANNYAGSKYGVIVHGVSISAAGTIYLNNGIIINNRSFQITGTSPGRSTPVCEIEHTGDGATSSTPHLWISWGRTKLYSTRLSWQGTSVGWQGTSSIVTVDSSTPALDYVPARWDGSRWVMLAINSNDSTIIDVYERTSANSATSIKATPQHTNGAVRAMALSYDTVTKNLRVYAVGTTNATLYRIDFVRATGLWGSWVQVSADAITGSTPAQFAIRRGGTAPTGKYDVMYLTGTSTPWTLKALHESLQYAPGTPVWDTSTVPYTNGGAADVGAGLLLDWTFVDQDSTDTQASYALRRQIGAGAFTWWRVSDSTWQAVETFNASGTTSVTLPSAWASGSDANHQFAVKTRDSGALDSPYSAALAIVPSVLVNPTITAPTVAQVITVNSLTVTWTVAEQTQFRVRLLTNPGNEVMFTSDWVTSTDLTYTPPYGLENGTVWTLELRTKNNEGLASTPQVRAFSVAYTTPAAPTLVATGNTPAGGIAVAITNLTPTGGQPSVASQSISRRPITAAATPLNANPFFTTNTTGWSQGGGGAAGTFTRSTTQAHEGVASARYVPPGSGTLTPQIECTPVAIDPTKTYVGSAWIRPDTANKPILVSINWYTSGASYLGSSQVTVAVPTAGVWHYLEVVANPGLWPTAGLASVGAGANNTPAAVDAWYADEIILRLNDPNPGDRIATLLPSGATFLDARAAARTLYEYRVTTFGSNGAQISSPWTP